MELSDYSLIARVQEDDFDAFEELVRRYKNYVYTLCFRMMVKEEDAEDVCQEVLIEIFDSIKDLREVKAFKSWLYKLTTRSCLDVLRKKKKLSTESIEALTEAGGAAIQRALSSRSINPENEVLRGELRHASTYISNWFRRNRFEGSFTRKRALFGSI